MPKPFEATAGGFKAQSMEVDQLRARVAELEKERDTLRHIAMDMVEALCEEVTGSESGGMTLHNASRMSASREFLGMKPWGKP